MKRGGANFSANTISNSIRNTIQNSRINRSDDFMVLIFIGILVVVGIFMMYRAYTYTKIQCPPGLIRAPYLVYAFTGKQCISSKLEGEKAKIMGVVPGKPGEPAPPAPEGPSREPPREMTLLDDTVTNVMMKKPITPDTVSDEVPLPTGTKKEVFHIANQDFTYEQARCKCSSYGARLATHEDIVDAYNKGADWCSYGWAEGQRAYYPTQKCSWDKYQAGPKELRNSCGLPGVNGGFFPNPNMKFGATCFGVKPAGKVVKQKPVKTCDKGVCELPTNEDAAMRKKTDDVVGFNHDQWNE